MKKFIKLLSIIVMVSFIFTFLSGCKKITKMKESLGYFDNDMNVIFNDVKYKQFTPASEMYLDINYENTIHISKKEMPVLISYFFTEDYAISDDGLFIEAATEDKTYCRADKYEEITQSMLEDKEFTDYMYTYEEWGSLTSGYKTHKYKFTKPQIEALKKAIDEGEIINSSKAERIVSSSRYPVDVYACTGNLLYREYAMRIYELNEDYYIEIEDYKETLEEDNYKLYKVPIELKEDFKSIMKPYIDNEKKQNNLEFIF